MSRRHMTKSEMRKSRRATAKAHRVFTAWHRQQKGVEAMRPLLVVAGVVGALWIINGGWSA